ncbi:MAG: hypothetical protein ACE5IE_06300, partial [Dehalococcoidia bacterium]
DAKPKPNADAKPKPNADAKPKPNADAKPKPNADADAVSYSISNPHASKRGGCGNQRGAI